MIEKDGLSVEAATEKHGSVMTEARQVIEKGLGRTIATSNTPKALLK